MHTCTHRMREVSLTVASPLRIGMSLEEAGPNVAFINSTDFTK